MKEIVSLHCGGLGIDVGVGYWKSIIEEHGNGFITGRYSERNSLKTFSRRHLDRLNDDRKFVLGNAFGSNVSNDKVFYDLLDVSFRETCSSSSSSCRIPRAVFIDIDSPPTSLTHNEFLFDSTRFAFGNQENFPRTFPEGVYENGSIVDTGID